MGCAVFSLIYDMKTGLYVLTKYLDLPSLMLTRDEPNIEIRDYNETDLTYKGLPVFEYDIEIGNHALFFQRHNDLVLAPLPDYIEETLWPGF